jgi:hypothetical protein
MEASDTEVILKAIFEGVGLAASENKRVTYVFDCTTEKGPKQIAVTIGPYVEEDEDDGTH